LAQTVAGSVAAASESENKQGIVVTGSRIARRDYTATSPTVTVDTEPLAKSSRQRADDDSAAVAIVVTGSRISASAAKAARRGDWNICTVNDPARSLERCKRQIGQNAQGDMGRAAARIEDGLTKAWAGDEAGAISAFDAAIDIRPKLAFAYLNRGMAYARLGQSERAVKDFDQAINYAPYDARAYYQRSVALRALGKDARAVTDAERAVSLDRQYEDLFD
jgi:tetratricopeptide (TPR) repeat protein